MIEYIRNINADNDREMEYNIETSDDNKEKIEVRVVSEEHMQYLRENFKDNGKILKIYHDEVHDRYYIDVFAAFELGFISYLDASKMFDRGSIYYEISKATFERLKEIFPGRIIIQVLAVENDYDDNHKFIYADDSDDNNIYNNYKLIMEQLEKNQGSNILFGESLLNGYKKIKGNLFNVSIEFPIVNDSIDEKEELSRMYNESLNNFDFDDSGFNNKKY